MIKFGNLTLTAWTDQPQPDIEGYPNSLDRHRLFKTTENEWKIGVSIKPHPFTKNMWYAMFYHQFSILNDHFPPGFEAADSIHAREQVDDFLLRMSKLTPFL